MEMEIVHGLHGFVARMPEGLQQAPQPRRPHASPENLADWLREGRPAVIVEYVGRGRVVAFAEDPNFRAYWYGSQRLFLNAVFFGQLLRKPADDGDGG